MRVCIAPLEIAGYGYGLETGFRRLGIEADLLTGAPHPFAYKEHVTPNTLVAIWQKIGVWYHAIPRTRLPLKILAGGLHAVSGMLVLLWALGRYDVFIFLFARSFTNTSFELWLLKRLGKKTVFVFLGSDTRPPYMDGGIVGPGEIHAQALALESWIKSRRVSMLERYADLTVVSPGTSQFFRRPYLDFLLLGLPRVISASPCPAIMPPGGPVRILHCPSVQTTKGSAEILDAIERLKAKGHAIELMTLHGVSNARVLEAIGQCDFVVDQLFSDTPMATFTCEAAALGKPAVVGGYFALEMEQYYSLDDIPPTLFVLPENLESAIERLVVDHDFRRQLGLRAQQFVTSRWTPEAVAGKLMQALEGNAPLSWWRDPLTAGYTQGYGMTDARSREVAKVLVEQQGEKALRLDGAPRLKALLLARCEATGRPRP